MSGTDPIWFEDGVADVTYCDELSGFEQVTQAQLIAREQAERDAASPPSRIDRIAYSDDWPDGEDPDDDL